MQGMHAVENKILLVSYNIRLTKVIMTLSVPSFQNAINLGKNSIIPRIFPAKKIENHRNSLRNICKFYIRKHKSRITMSHRTHALHKNPFKTDLALKQNITFALTTTTRSDPQSAARRTSSCGRKKKFLCVHYFWAVL